jgi:hypothetical protein
VLFYGNYFSIEHTEVYLGSEANPCEIIVEFSNETQIMCRLSAGNRQNLVFIVHVQDQSYVGVDSYSYPFAPTVSKVWVNNINRNSTMCQNVTVSCVNGEVGTCIQSN